MKNPTLYGCQDIQETQAEDDDIPMNMLIQTIVVITICSLGLGANTCAFFVLLKSSIIKSTTGIYLTFLSVFDNLVLITQLLHAFSDISNVSNVACKLFWIVRTAVLTISNHIVVTMTIEKCYILVNPYKPKPTRKQALTIATASVVILTLILAIHFSITTGLVTVPVDRTFRNSSTNITDDNKVSMTGYKTTACDILPQYTHYTQNPIRVISVLIMRLHAPAIVLICNLIIILYLRQHAMQVGPMITVNATANPQNDKRITKLLLIVSLCFAILTLPSTMYFLIVSYFNENISDAVALDNPAYFVVMSCLLVNHSINYILYIMGSKTFRKEAQVAFNSLLTICVRNNQN